MNNEKISYEELLALQILNKFLNLDITNFIKSESPDWKNDNENIGLEVTIVDDAKKFFSELEKINKNRIKDKDKFRKRYIKNGGYAIPKETAQMLNLKSSMIDIGDGYFYLTYSQNNNFEKINRQFINKIEKLNNNFYPFKDNRLFIFSTVYVVDDKRIKNELETLILESSKYKYKYNVIYMILLHKLCVFDLENKKYTHMNIDKKLMDEINIDVEKKIKQI